MENLTPRQMQLMQLGEQAEAYIQEQARQQAEHGPGAGNRSISRTEYDTAGSRRDWEQSIQ